MSSDNISANVEQSSDATSDKQHKSIFDEQFSALIIQFDKLCEDNKLDAGVMVVAGKDHEPRLYIKGHIYECGCLMAESLRNIKAGIDHSLCVSNEQ